MARVTVEDCVQLVPNRFKLVMLASQRARELSVGGELTVERDNDKNPVVALREIADRTVELGKLENALIASLQKQPEMEETEEELEAQLAAEEALLAASAGAAAETGEQRGEAELDEDEEIAEDMLSEEPSFEDEKEAED